jgi:hypothetical protein
MTPVQSASTAQLQTTGSLLNRRATLALGQDGESIEIGADDSEFGDQFTSALLPVRKNTDYVLASPMRLVSGRVAAKVKAEDPRITLASIALPKTRKTKRARNEFPDSHLQQPAGSIKIPFATGGITQVRLVLSNDGRSADPAVVQVGEAKLYEMGPTPRSWTSYPRSVIRGIQKNVFKTEVVRPLILIGVVLLALARRRRALVLLLAVPIYYLTTHSAFSTEVRYILAIHYFLFIIVAIALYCIASLIVRSATALLSRKRLPGGFHASTS